MQQSCPTCTGAFGILTVVIAAHVLVPDGTFVALMLGWAAVPLLLVLWPLVESGRRGRWWWFVATLLLAPVGGIAWILVGRWRRAATTK